MRDFENGYKVENGYELENGYSSPARCLGVQPAFPLWGRMFVYLLRQGSLGEEEAM